MLIFSSFYSLCTHLFPNTLHKPIAPLCLNMRQLHASLLDKTIPDKSTHSSISSAQMTFALI